MSRLMLLFSVASFTPVPLIALGALHGGLWAVAALLSMTVLTFAIDRLIARTPRQNPQAEFPATDPLAAVLAVSHLMLMPLVVAALAGDWLGLGGKIALFLAAGTFMGQVSNANAHELIHHGDARLRALGIAVYVSLLYGHHNSAHRLVHHVHVATHRDPNSAPLGLSFWRFAPRAWIGSFRAGWQAESARLRHRRAPAWRHPYAIYVGGALALVILSAALWGLAGALLYVVLASYATIQLLMTDYVQHYGLRRRVQPDGRIEPVRAWHSWDAWQPWSSAMLLNAPRHGDHHSHPMRRFPALTLPGSDGAFLPRPLPVMAAIALVPRRWRKVMDPRARAVMARHPGNHA